MKTCSPSTSTSEMQSVMAIRSKSRTPVASAPMASAAIRAPRMTSVARLRAIAQVRRPEAGPLISPSGRQSRIRMTSEKVKASRNFSSSCGSV